MTDIGTAIVSYIEPSPGYAREFNRWYEDDHFPSAVLAGPGVLGGARFVATRACKALRPPDGTLFGDPARGSYLGVAFVAPGMQAEWDAWVAREMETITAEGRLFPHREHVHTAIYRLIGPRGDVLAGDFSGVVAIAAKGDVPALSSPSITLELERTIISSADPPPHQLVLAFCNDDPLVTFRRINLSPAVGFASPFLATIPGTDAYTEEL
jgi:hypothetical protein